MSLALFLGLIGFNPRLAWGDMAALEVPPLLSPGSWSGTLAERMQALGYEVASIDLEAGMVTVTFDDGRVLTVDRATGAFALVDARGQEELTGSVFARFLVNNDDMAEVSATFVSHDEPGVTHRLGGFLSSDLSSNGVVAVQGILDAQAVDQGVDLTDLSYRPDGSTDTPDRHLDQARGVVAGDTIGNLTGGERISWLVGIILVLITAVGAALIAGALLGSCQGLGAGIKSIQGGGGEHNTRRRSATRWIRSDCNEGYRHAAMGEVCP